MQKDYDTNSKHVVFWNMMGELVYASVEGGFHIGRTVMCYLPNMEKADEYVKQFLAYKQKCKETENAFADPKK